MSGRLTALDPGFAAATGDGPDEPEPEGSTRFRLASRWGFGTGRFLRLGFEAERLSLAREGWSDTGRRLELELGESWARGYGVTVLWRRVTGRPLGGAVPESARTLRAEFRRTRSPWTLTLRVEERSDDGGRGSLASLRVARAGGVPFEVRAALVGVEGADPGLFWYRRRAGGLYGWDRVPAGVWGGAWLRLPVGPLRAEVSLDARAGAYEAAAAVTARAGGGS
jgi:hypothetical protein